MEHDEADRLYRSWKATDAGARQKQANTSCKSACTLLHLT